MSRTERLKRKRIQSAQLHRVSSEKDVKEWIASYQQYDITQAQREVCLINLLNVKLINQMI